MPEDGTTDGRLDLIGELVPLRRVPVALRVTVVFAVLAGCGAVAQLALLAQHHFSSSGASDRWSLLLARGSTAATAWPGWVAALFFGIAVLRLWRGAPEPPAGRAPVESLTLTEMRHGLLREYRLGRAALAAVAVVAALDSARAARYIAAAVAGDRLARESLAATLVEALGLVVAATVLALWTSSFRVQLQRLGAITEPS